jgi:hypothetical protein
MAISTYGIKLKVGETAETLEQLVCIKDFPDLGGAPEQIETTTLCDSQQTFINGIKSMGVMEFTANYDSEDYDAIEALSGQELFYELEFGESGADGVFKWKGEHTVRVTGGGVNSVVEMVISVAPSTEITKS